MLFRKCFTLIFIAVLTSSGALLSFPLVSEESVAQVVPEFTWDFDKLDTHLDVSPGGEGYDLMRLTLTNPGTGPMTITMDVPDREQLNSKGIYVSHIRTYNLAPGETHELPIGVSADYYITSHNSQFTFTAEVTAWNNAPYRDDNPKEAQMTVHIKPYSMIELSSPDAFDEYFPGTIVELHLEIFQRGNFPDNVIIQLTNLKELEDEGIQVQLSTPTVLVEAGKAETIKITITTQHVLWSDEVFSFDMQVTSSFPGSLKTWSYPLIIRTHGIYVWHPFYILVYVVMIAAASYKVYTKRVKKSRWHSGAPGQYGPHRKGELRRTPSQKLAKKYKKKIIDTPAADARPKLPRKPSRIYDAPTIEPRKKIKEMKKPGALKPGETIKPREKTRKGLLEITSSMGGSTEAITARETYKKGLLEKAAAAQITRPGETVKPREKVRMGLLEKASASKIGGSESVKPREKVREGLLDRTPRKGKDGSEPIKPREEIKAGILKKTTKGGSKKSGTVPVRPPKPILKKDSAGSMKKSGMKEGVKTGKETGTKIGKAKKADTKPKATIRKTGIFGKKGDKKKGKRKTKTIGPREIKTKTAGKKAGRTIGPRETTTRSIEKKKEPKKAESIGVSATRKAAPTDVDLRSLAKMQEDFEKSKKGSASERLKALMEDEKEQN